METIDGVRHAWPQWRIDHVANGTDGYVYVGHPLAEEKKPPVWEHAQMVRGLKNRVVEEDIGEFERQIGFQDKLRRQMADEGETPFDGTTYVEAERARAEVSGA